MLSRGLVGRIGGREHGRVEQIVVGRLVATSSSAARRQRRQRRRCGRNDLEDRLRHADGGRLDEVHVVRLDFRLVGRSALRVVSAALDRRVEPLHHLRLVTPRRSDRLELGDDRVELLVADRAELRRRHRACVRSRSRRLGRRVAVLAVRPEAFFLERRQTRPKLKDPCEHRLLQGVRRCRRQAEAEVEGERREVGREGVWAGQRCQDIDDAVERRRSWPVRANAP